MRPLKISVVFLLALFQVCVSFGQNNLKRFDLLELRLKEYAVENPKIDNEIDISITGTLQEFAMAFAKESKVNLSIDPTINPNVVVNFAGTKPRDILLYLCRHYNLTLGFTGTIIILIPFNPPRVQYVPKEVEVKYNAYNNKLELNLNNDTLDQVVRKISQVTKKNVITTKAAIHDRVSGYIGEAIFEDALKQMARRNDLVLMEDESGFFIFDKASPAEIAEAKVTAQKVNQKNNRNRRGSNNNSRRNTGQVKFTSRIDSLLGEVLTLEAMDVPVMDIIKEASSGTGQSYYFSSLPDERISVNVEDITYDQLLAQVLQGTKHTYKKIDDVYVIGERSQEGLRNTKVVQLQHRTAKDISQVIPQEISEGLQIQEFIELNSIILSGSAVNIAMVEQFLKGIDKSVPVITIELLIIDFRNDSELNLGIEAGVAENPPAAGGLVYPGLDFTFSAKGINNLLGSLSGNGIINLGRVSPNFYATLQAVETNGYAKVLSKPRLSTINGKEATLSIGETRYYQVERTTLQGNQSPISLQDRRFESVNADFTITILPVVSGDENVTLDITVSQSDFIGQIQPNAPPPQVNRSFTSNIRLLDGEMVVLGGLESKSVEESGSGLPWISRVPILKWFFSKRRKAKSKSELVIFVRPNIIY